MEHEYHAFISHANEDKETVARPLASALAMHGWSVWLDESELMVGDSLAARINTGLSQSRFGVVILSPSFFAKNWPVRELDALAARQVGGEEVILPVLHNMSHEALLARYPSIADLVAISTDGGVESVAGALTARMQRDLGIERSRTSPTAGAAEVVECARLEARDGPEALGTRIRGVYADVVEDLLDVLAHLLADIFVATRYFEERTGIRNDLAHWSLVDALGHIGVLAERAPGMTHSEQRESVWQLQDNLRRALADSYENLVRMRLDDVAMHVTESDPQDAHIQVLRTRIREKMDELQDARLRLDRDDGFDSVTKQVGLVLDAVDEFQRAQPPQA